mmetsp:Transcript_32843/g.74868  ORF Transcript_32843/g.74868 Transcript_32843/m.74868 type:complete len:208 (-) Transcript_32843:331-954(-)
MRPAALLLALCAPAVALAFMTAVPGASLASLSGSAAISRHTHTVRSLRAAGAAPRLRMAGGPAEATETVAPSALVSLFKEEMADWGLVRWILVNPSGSVLETTAQMGMGTNLFTIPGKGTYCTISTADKLFECHINMDKAKSVVWSQEPAKVGGHMLHVMRVKDEAGAIMLSCMLQYDPAQGAGNYFPGKIAAFERVMGKFNSEMAV